MKEKINWGVLGCADIVERRILPALCGEVNNGVFHAVASRGESPRLARVKEAYHPREVYLDYQALLDDPAVDAVYIPLPNALHKEWSVRALRAGKHVLCEKPMALTLEDLHEMANAAEAGGVYLMEAFACMHSPLYGAIREIIATGDIGMVRMVNTRFCGLLEDAATNTNTRPELGGGSINAVGCYNALNLRQVTGREPLGVKAMATWLPTGADAGVTAVLDMGGGIHATWESSVESATNREISVLGSEGYLLFNKTPNSWGELQITVANRSGSKRVLLHTRNTYALEMEQFGRCIAGEEQPLVTLEQSRNNTRVLQMLRDAVYGGKG